LHENTQTEPKLEYHDKRGHNFALEEQPETAVHLKRTENWAKKINGGKRLPGCAGKGLESQQETKRWRSEETLVSERIGGRGRTVAIEVVEGSGGGFFGWS
jgi:hypothetical protein